MKGKAYYITKSQNYSKRKQESLLWQMPLLQNEMVTEIKHVINGNSKQTLGELNWERSELQPSTKLDCWLSPLCGFHAMDADMHDGFPYLETESITFWNSAYNEILGANRVTYNTIKVTLQKSKSHKRIVPKCNNWLVTKNLG